MSIRTWKETKWKAIECVKNVQETYNLGIYSQWGYYFAKSIVTPYKDIKRNKSLKTAPKPTGDKIKLRVPKSDYIQLAKDLISFCEKKGRMRNYLDYKGQRIRCRLYVYLFAKVISYRNYHDDFPAYVDINYKSFYPPTSKCKSPYVSEPHFYEEGAGYLGQINPYNCGPHTVRQALRKFGIDISESTLAEVAGTGYDGTDHEGLNTAMAWAARKAGVNLTVEWVNFSDLGKNDAERFKALGEILCQKNKAAFTHIGYEDSGEDYGDDIFGHYEYLDRINTDTGYVRALNSLGYRDGYGYYGHLQDRKFSLEAHYLSQISQKGICIITKK